MSLIVVVPAVAFAQSGSSPFDTGFTAIQTLFTGTIAKVASLVAIVIGGYGFAHGEPGAKKMAADAAALPRQLRKVGWLPEYSDFNMLRLTPLQAIEGCGAGRSRKHSYSLTCLTLPADKQADTCLAEKP